MFLKNEGENGGAVVLSRNVSVVIGQFSEVSFVRNRAQESGGAVYARESQIVITGQNLSFVENEADDGGAIALTRGSTIYLEDNSSVPFVRNHAYHYGGTIYYVDDYTEDYADFSKCFYGSLSPKFLTKDASLIDILNYIKSTHFSIEFYNNTAEFARTAIYGGSVDFCKFSVDYQVLPDYLAAGTSQTSIFDSLFHFHPSTQQLSFISSNPTRVCLCSNMSIPDCSVIEYTITAYPGETFTIPAVGQRFGAVPSTLHSNFVYSADTPTNENKLPALQYTQLVNGNCTNLMYTILSSSNRTEDMELTVEKQNIPHNKVINDALEDFKVNKTLINFQFSNLAIHIKL